MKFTHKYIMLVDKYNYFVIEYVQLCDVIQAEVVTKYVEMPCA
jgi:hypothetical protein